MAVYKRTYKAYRGALTPAWSRFAVLARYGLATLFNSRPFTAYCVLCMLPFLVGLVFIYFVHSSMAQLITGVNLGPNPIVNNYWFLTVLSIEAWMSFVLTAWSGPGMISKDFANHAVQLYLSRPLSRAEYLVGKASVLFALLSCTTWIPGLVLFFVQAQLQEHGWGWENLWMAGAIIVAGVLWIAVISLLSMAVAVWVKWRIAATALMLGIFFLLPGLGAIVDAILRTKWGSLINFPYAISMIWAHLFRLQQQHLQQGGFEQIPLWSAWASVLSLCAFCIWVLNQRLRAREVERA